MTLPKVYVVLPAYNAGKWIRAAMESIYLQTYKGEIHLIVVDDCSEDDTVKVFYRVQGPHTYLIKHRKNRGPGRAHSTGFRFALDLSSGPHAERNIIAIQGADDISTPERIEKSVDYLLAHKEHPIVSCSLLWFGDKSGRFIAKQYAPPTPGIVCWDWVYRLVGVHRDHLSHDTVWCTMAGEHKIGWGLINENLYLYRRHPLQHSRTKLQTVKSG